MRVAVVTTVHPSNENRILHKECVALARGGHEVHFISRGPTQFVEGIQHHTYTPARRRVLRPLIDAYRAFRIVTSLAPDAVHVHDPELLPWLTIQRALKGSVAIYDAHENLAAQVDSKTYIPRPLRAPAKVLARLLDKLASRACDAIVLAEPELTSLYPKARRVLAVQNYPWGGDYDIDTPVAEGDGEGESKIGERLVVGYLGAISEDRGISTMIRAVGQSTHKPILRLAGRFQPEALKEGVVDRDGIEYVGVLDPEDIPDYLAGVDVGLCLLKPMPNYVNAKSTKVYEYMREGIPFLYSNFPHWVELYGDACGIPVDAENVEEITSALDRLLGDPELRNRLGGSGVQYVARHNFENEGDALLNLYATFSGGRRRSRASAASSPRSRIFSRWMRG